MKFKLITAIMVFGVFSASAQNNNRLSEKAPTDRPISVNNAEGLDAFDSKIEPLVKKAQQELPKIKRQFDKGFKKGESFFLTTRIYDAFGNFEQVFVKVQTWDNGKIQGTIANQLTAVKDFEFGQSIEFPESAVLDWLITDAEGKEKGNYIGKYLDSIH